MKQMIDDKYIITDNGKVYTILKNGIREQKPRKHNNGYLRATINGKDSYIHRLVAQCFLDNPNNYPEVNHKDGNKENNCVDNLEWCNRSQNNLHAFQSGLRDYEELKRMAKMPKYKSRRFTNEQVNEIRNSKLSDTELAQKYKVVRSVIWQIRKRISYKDVM